MNIVRQTLASTLAFVADMRFSQGSIVTNYKIYLPESTGEEQVQEIVNALADAANNNSLGDFTVDDIQIDGREFHFRFKIDSVCTCSANVS